VWALFEVHLHGLNCVRTSIREYCAKEDEEEEEEK
jgi:hypothetical protein